ncbi:N2227-like protein-domain-containing protein [Gaertneriomyces semiglobifer]|nr:N2227-like protein-domain-containing protein [Gaertneriomyces semiglobifer]
MFLNDPDAVSDADRLLEAQHFAKCVRAFQSYRVRSLATNAKRRRDFNSIPPSHKAVLPQWEAKVDASNKSIEANAKFLEMVVDGVQVEEPQQENPRDRVMEGDLDKVRSTLRQFVRDWSEEGSDERAASYEPILAELEERFKDVPEPQRGSLKVLVPGAGLGRLAYEIVKRGFSCQGNEFSFYMLLGSHFILNRASQPNQYIIHPWVHSFTNHTSARSLLRPVTVPDTVASNIPPTADFSMVAGDFTEVYAEPEQASSWDVVVTCFFIDTAKNFVEYVEVIRKILKNGGLWINLGPLLWHWEGSQNDVSVELGLDEVMDIIKEYGFSVENERRLSTTYAANREGMLKYVYDCAYFVAIKGESRS